MSNIAYSPIEIDFDDFELSSDYIENQILINKKVDDIARIDCFGVFRGNAKKLICLLPSAQPQSSAQINPIFHRWSWAYQFRDCHVICVSDPALYYSDIHASWFIGKGKIDLVNEIAVFLKEILERIGFSEDQVILYGSSMGGFGALMIASHLRGALAIAEVPQIDLRKYPIKSSIEKIEKEVLSGVKIEDYALTYPERVSVLDRFNKKNYIPPFKLITNLADEACADHIDIFNRLRELREDSAVVGDLDLTITAEDFGHKPLPTPYGVAYIRSAITAGWRTAEAPKKLIEKDTVENNKIVNLDEYRKLIDQAVDRSKSLKYIRTENEKNEYLKIKEILYRAGGINPSADWPFLKICSVEKLWTNSFNAEILNAAITAFERRESLEAFIYICRGLLYNNEAKVAVRLIADYQSKCSDLQISNVGNIFRSFVEYDSGNYEEYLKLIKDFRKNKKSDFDPYIAIPVSTVYTESVYADSLYSKENVSLVNCELHVAAMNVNNIEYIVSVSCDQKYFSEYAKYLVKSFTKNCSAEAALHLSIVDGDSEKIESSLREWGATNVYFAIQNISAGDNVGPIASLTRFSHIFQLLSEHKLPVFVLDLDTVIKKPLASMIYDFPGVDICSRILGKGVAPWEKYTGGFSLFKPTRLATEVAKNISYVAGLICTTERKQWWIDQNCFEAGIRSVLQAGGNLKIENISNVRDTYCMMPVGSGDSKKYNLETALKVVMEPSSPLASNII
ncbi:hypothetical protein N5D77_19705 [Comamonas thiooxydans]|uniref:Uncharacterized protein n=1 Tax=Comamonas thiooxydans TaxID=363952 RepID=A0AA42Q564_9BURK|nr:hypothetical protein [Comamonas thiooxydans]MDH1336344.1 hypothetical protein [Comamonas thiooxydans]MDH1742159.1 hypothetical protein [Comamonas thiooxydans]MDH1788805.1 hypothetical protein [Comamonas thiooxydans]